MDSDVCEPDGQPERVFRGFRKRWQTGQRNSDVESSGPSSADVHEIPIFGQDMYQDDIHDLFGDDAAFQTDATVEIGDWDSFDGLVTGDSGTLGNRLKRSFLPGEGVEDVPASPQVLDPNHHEAAWKASALTAEIKRAKNSHPKLPWEIDGTAFKSRDIWQGTIISSLDKMLTPTSLGARDVMDSQVVLGRQCSEVPGTDLRILPIQLKRARKEPLEEDIRRQALHKFRDILLQDPLATQLGTSLRGRFDAGTLHDDIEQSFRDCFRMKAASTLQKRSASLDRLAKLLKTGGQLYPLRLTEQQLYEALCKMRSAGAGATSAQHVIEALHFVDSTARFLIIDLSDVVSARCKGVARDMYLTKSPLRQKHPLAVEQVQWLEKLMESLDAVFRCILGQLLFCIHACCRWKDAQRLKSVTTEYGHGEMLLFADALASKTTLTAEAKTRFLPYAALGTGVASGNWANFWLAARLDEGLKFAEFALPSFSEKRACWLDTPMSASEATIWLREFLEGAKTPLQPELIGSHSCKTTLLTWAGRSVKLVFTPAERRLLGHHMDANMKSVLCYSRESYTSLYAKVLSMFRMIRNGEFDPDQTAIERVVQMADGSEEVLQDDLVNEPEDDILSHSDSSVASLDDLHELHNADDDVDGRLVSLFPAFPGVPESSLLVHKISGLVHVVSEDDVLSCGRPTSIHFKQYSKVADRDHLAACSQCLRSFQNRKPGFELAWTSE